MTRNPDSSKADTPVLTIARLARQLENATTGELSWSQFRVLGLLADGDERSTLLARRLSLAKPTLTGVVDSLVERDLVARQGVPGDRRVVHLSITAAGLRLLAETSTRLRDVLDDVLARCEAPSAVLAALDDLARAIDLRWADRIREREHERDTPVA